MDKKDVFFIVVTALLFSTMEVFLKIAGTELDAFQITFIRFAIGGLFLLPFTISDMKKRSLKLTLSDWTYLTFLGIICICVSMLLFQIGVDNANANLVSVIICANPLFVMIFAHFIVNDGFNRRKAVVLVISLLGLVIAADPFDLANGNTYFGIICAVLASVTFAIYTTCGKLRIAKIGGIPQTCLSFIIGSIIMLIPMVIMDKPIISGINTSNILLVLYLGIAVTGIGYYMYFQAINSCGPANASIVFFLKPVFAPVIALVVLQEAIHWNMVLGIALLLVGSVIHMRSTLKADIEKVEVEEEIGLERLENFEEQLEEQVEEEVEEQKIKNKK